MPDTGGMAFRNREVDASSFGQHAEARSVKRGLVILPLEAGDTAQKS